MRLACFQANVAFNDPMPNADRAIAKMRELKNEGVELLVLPEAYLTGYCVECREDAQQIALRSPGTHEALVALQEAVDELDMLLVVGYAENRGGALYNAASLLEPGSPIRTYRKTHLPDLGYDKFVHAGEEMGVFDTRLGRIGILICFDLRAPETARVLALQGAELIVLPTNWPVGAEVSAQHIAIARAAENRVFVATCDRVGEENGFRFIGLSKIIHPSGRVLAAAGADEETLVADVDLAEARQKRTVGIPGKYETEAFQSRRPEMYGAITEPVRESTPL
jgi:5-aminopentanamidase